MDYYIGNQFISVKFLVGVKESFLNPAELAIKRVIAKYLVLHILPIHAPIDDFWSKFKGTGSFIHYPVFCLTSHKMPQMPEKPQIAAKAANDRKATNARKAANA